MNRDLRHLERVVLEGCRDDIDAITAGVDQIARSIASFRDRANVALLSLLGELADVPKIALRQHERPEDVPTYAGPSPLPESSAGQSAGHLHRVVVGPDGLATACCDLGAGPR